MTFARSFISKLFSLFPNKLVYIASLEIEAKKVAYAKTLLQRHGAKFSLASSAFIASPGAVSFGDDCTVNEFVHILGGGGLTCGNGVWIANSASIITVTHPSDVEFIGDHPQIEKPIHIEDNVWIGSRALIMPGVTLGRSCIVAAGAVVTKDVPAYAVVAGVPAKTLRYKPIAP